MSNSGLWEHYFQFKLLVLKITIIHRRTLSVFVILEHQ